MKNNELIEHKENIFFRLVNFIKKIFFKSDTTNKKNSVKNREYKYNFSERIQIKEKEEIRLKKMQLQYDNGELNEDDMSDEDIEKLIVLYKKETEELNKDTLKRKIHIEKMLKEIKK